MSVNQLTTLMVYLVVNYLLTLFLLHLQKLLHPNKRIHCHLQLSTHDCLDLLHIALARCLFVLILPRTHKVLIRPEGILFTLLLEFSRLTLDQRHTLVELAQAFVTERIGLGEVRGDDGVGGLQVGYEWLGEVGVQVLDEGYGFLAVRMVLVGLDAVGDDWVGGKVLEGWVSLNEREDEFESSFVTTSRNCDFDLSPLVIGSPIVVVLVLDLVFWVSA